MRYPILTIALFYCVIVLSIQVTHQRVIRDAEQLKSNAQLPPGKTLLIYSRASRRFLQIVSKRNITADAEKDDPYAVVIIRSGKGGLTIMGEKSQLYLCVLRKNGKMVAMNEKNNDKCYCFYREELGLDVRDVNNLYTMYELVDKPGWSLLFSKDGRPRRANNTNVESKRLGFMKKKVDVNQR